MTRLLLAPILLGGCLAAGGPSVPERTGADVEVPGAPEGDSFDAPGGSADPSPMDAPDDPPGAPPESTPPGRAEGEPPAAPEPPPAPAARRPVVLVHGITPSGADFDVLVARLLERGWTVDRIAVVEYSSPSWGCNVDNAAELAEVVERLREDTGADRVDIVAHSMGSLSSRWYVKELGGLEVVDRYVSLGGMHRGLFSPCLSPLPVCVWQELCESGDLVTRLNAAPATPGPVRWTSIAGGADETVSVERTELDGAEHVVVDGVEHSGPAGLLEDARVFEHLMRALE